MKVESRFLQAVSPSEHELLHQIFSNMKTDFTANVSGHYSDSDMEEIYKKAKDMLFREISTGMVLTENDLLQAWNRVVTDFYQTGHWGFETIPGAQPKKKKTNAEMAPWGFLRAMLLSALFTKPSLYFFGVQYTNNPGEGYGIGLIATVLITFGSYAYLIRKYWHMKD